MIKLTRDYQKKLTAIKLSANHLTYQAKINSGSFYTPFQLVNYVWEFVTPFLTKNTTVLDTSAGKGSFFINQKKQELIPNCGRQRPMSG